MMDSANSEGQHLVSHAVDEPLKVSEQSTRMVEQWQHKVLELKADTE